jgi:CSLREA domain-containing protein
VRRLVVATVLALGALLALAPSALAETFTVDSNGDAADAELNGTCDSDGGDPVVCTLRAAIQEANNETDNPGEDTIEFDGDFDGVAAAAASTITIGSALPTITTEIHVDGGNCPLTALAPGPCAGVGYAAGPPAALAFVVAADDVSIEGLAITNSLVAINVTTGSSEFVMHNTWLGLGLNFAAGSNGIGVLLGPDADGAAIGSHESAHRNVIVANGTGVDIVGADDTHLEGNWIGVAPNGTSPAPNAEGVEITGTSSGGGFDATGTVVGDIPTGFTTPACDTQCNAISNSLTNGIDLQGEGGENETPAGATTIQGNYIGINAVGTAVAGNATGIRVGDADQVTIGGPANTFAANHITGGQGGVFATTEADDLIVASNRIGLAPPGGTAALSPPSQFGVDIFSPAANPTEVSANTIAMTTGDAVRVRGDNATVDSNRIGRGVSGSELTGGDIGLRLLESVAATVTGNTVANTSAVGPAAVSIEGGADNVLTGNFIRNSGSIGLRIAPGTAPSSPGNQIGGDTAPEANTITGSAGDAIEIAGDGSDGNLILRNLGANGGLFIDLGADGLGNSPATGPNGGIQAPAITAADDNSATGTASPGTTVRVFSKTTSANGEIQGFLSSAVADGGGNWQATYSPSIVPAFVGATQTDGTLGTSEMDVEQVVIPPDTTPPNTEITAAPKPKVKTKKRRKRVTFEFTASEDNASFECSRDGGAFSDCSSPFSYKAKRGKHTFAVRAVDEVGNADATPATHSFKVKRKRKKK